MAFLIFPSLSVLADEVPHVFSLVLYPHLDEQSSHAGKGCHIQPRTLPEEFNPRWQSLHWTFLLLCATCGPFSFYLNTVFYLCCGSEWEEHHTWIVLRSALPAQDANFLLLQNCPVKAGSPGFVHCWEINLRQYLLEEENWDKDNCSGRT